VGVDDSSSNFLQYLDKNGISLGKKIEVLSIEPFDGSLSVKVAGKVLSISNKIATNIYIQS
jgi:DtxR family Mn-dependent transcriptional regulator